LSFAQELPETEVETPVAELQPGDRIVLKPGDRVPTDGVVLTGASAVDEAMLTGESAPVDKKPGGEVYAGTVNLNGRLVVRVTATGEGTALARVIAAVQRAQSSRADIQRLGDRVSSVFVPMIVCVAAGAALWWGLAFDSAQRFHNALAPWLWHGHLPATAAAAAFIVAAAVFIVACPCAMGLATPAAIMAAANAAARRGILIRDGIALEKAGRVTTVVFDKTGTLTQGKPVVVKFQGFAEGADIHSFGRFPLTPALSPGERGNHPPAPDQALMPVTGLSEAEQRLFSLAAALARNSSHPLSQAIARAAETSAASGQREQSPASLACCTSADDSPSPGGEGRGEGGRIIFPPGLKSPPPLTDWREISGSGVQAALNDAAGAAIVRLGSVSWLRESGVNMAAGEAFMTEWSAQGASLVGLARDHTLTGIFALQDTLKPGAAEVVAQLRRQGLKICLLTGDNPLTAAGIARQTGIPAENVFAGVRPDQKAERVKDLQARGEKVAFVGDGINDAPALTQADLGIAVSRASDIARDAADIILLKSEIAAVPEALDLARATLRIIKQNLFWAFFYNALAVPLAATGFASPVICAAAMGCSDIIVIGNALRLLRRPNRKKNSWQPT
jgi:Cu+-exporting ATPase